MVLIGKIADTFPVPGQGLGVVFEEPPAVGLPWYLSVRVERADCSTFDADATGNWIRRTEGELVMLTLVGASVDEVPIGAVVYLLGARAEPDSGIE